MKKTLAMLLALAMSLSLLTGCGSKKDDAPAADNSDAAAGETTGEAKPGEGMKIALVCDKVGTQVFLTQMVEALNEAADKYGFEATVAECADSALSRLTSALWWLRNMTSSSAAAGSPATPSTRWPPSIPTLPTMP